MNETKFRAWLIKEKGYLQGFNLFNYHGYFNKGLKKSIKRYNNEWMEDEYILEQQAFGLTDKNNVEIYQGDIANSCYGIGIVLLTDQGFRFEFHLDTTDLWSMAVGREGKEFEIIGTIHEEPSNAPKA